MNMEKSWRKTVPWRNNAIEVVNEREPPMPVSLNDVLSPLVAPLVAWAVFAVSFLYNRSRLRNCLYLAVALLATVGYVTSLASESGYLPGLVVIFLALLFVLVVPFFLIGNGVVMLRREGRSLANLLSLIVGIIVLLGEAACVYVVLGTVQWAIPNTTIHRLVALFGISVFYFCCVFLMFITYSKFIEHVPHRRDFDFLIVHGAGLLNGDQVSKLLADRLDKAIEVYRRDATPPVIITSGGQGADETVSEAHAMALYLLDHGIPADHIVEEGESPDTMTNVINSKRIIDERPGRKRVALISSNYHVYRCLLDARKAGLRCTGIGARVAAYYWPSAVIREFIAVFTRPAYLALFIVCWLPCALLVFA